MSEHIPDWLSSLALDIYKIIQRYKAMSRFEEVVNTWAEDHQAEIAKQITWNKKRASYFEKTVTVDERLQNEQAGPPEEGWEFQHHVQHTENRHTIIQGWVPPELSISAEPEITNIFPLRRDHGLSLVEKYAALAVIYDCGRKGTDELPLWEWPDFSKEQTPSTMSDAKKCLSFEGLRRYVANLVPEDEEWLRIMLNDVEADIAEWAGVQRADLKTQTAEAVSETRSDRYVRWAKDHPLLSILYVLFRGIIIVGAVAGSLYGMVILYDRIAGAGKTNGTSAEKVEDQPIVSVRATVEIAIRSEEQVNARHPYNGAVLAFGKGKEPLLRLSSESSRAKQMGTSEVRYSSELAMKATDVGFRQPLSLLQQIEYAQVWFDIIPSNSEILSGTVVCIFNNHVPIELRIPPQKMREKLVNIPDVNMAEILRQHAESN